MLSEEVIRSSLTGFSELKPMCVMKSPTIAILAADIWVEYSPLDNTYALIGDDRFNCPLRFGTIRLVEWSKEEKMCVIGDRYNGRGASLWSPRTDRAAFEFFEQFVKDGYQVPMLTQWFEEHNASKKRKATEVEVDA